MIGCIAKATSDALHMDESEMDDVRWVSREQLQKAVEDSKRTDTPYQGLQFSCQHGLIVAKLRTAVLHLLAI